MTATEGLTNHVRRMQLGDKAACSHVFTVAAARLKRISAILLSKEPPTASFDAADLLQEVYLQKAGRLSPDAPITNREHFFALMAHGMRQILIDRSRSRNAIKRIMPSDFGASSTQRDARLNELSLLRSRLRKLDPKAHAVLALKTEVGLTWEAIALRTGLSVWECRAEYNHAVHWLRQQMQS